MSRAVIIDSNVAIKLFVQEDLSDRAQAIMARLTSSEAHDMFEVYAPDIMWAECANVLWKYVSFYNYSLDDAQADLHNLFLLAITPVPIGEALEADAFRLACTYGVAVYDAFYLALAQNLGGVLITADQKLLKRTGDGLPAVYLGDWLL